MNREKMQRIMNEIDHAMTEIDLTLWNWQTDLDMMSFIGQEISMKLYKAEDYDPVEIMTVRRVPLVKHVAGERIVIGAADVDLNSGVVQAVIGDQYAEIVGIPGSFSIMDEDPPLYDHDKIRQQLNTIIDPELYRNPYQRVPKVDLKMKVAGAWVPIDQIPDHVLENHPFFKKEI